MKIRKRVNRLSQIVLEELHKGDMLLYGKKSCVVLCKLRKDIVRDVYKSAHPVFRVEFKDGHKMCLSERNMDEFSLIDSMESDINMEEPMFSDESTLKHYREIASAMQ